MSAIDASKVTPFSGYRRPGRKKTSTKDRIDLKKLSNMSFAELDKLYRQLSPPDTLDTLNGRQDGIPLAIAGIHRTPLGNLVGLLARTPFFPWTGKSFSARSLIKGSGINRINLTIAKQEWFAFQTSFKSSLVDHRPCIHLNYDLRGNPWLVRQLVDELREVENGLFLGASLLKTRAGKIKLLYFAIGE